MRRFVFGFSLVLGVCCWVDLSAQTPLDAARTMAQAGLYGDWKNVDPHTRGMVRIIVDGNYVHPFGSCHPTACDWGATRAQLFASKVDEKDVFAMLAENTTKFSKAVYTVSLEPDGRLRVQVFTHFTDGSGRLDYSDIVYFTRS